jgi:hypothetical protein
MVKDQKSSDQNWESHEESQRGRIGMNPEGEAISTLPVAGRNVIGCQW